MYLSGTSRPYASPMADRQPAQRRRLGAWYTPASLIARMADALLDDVTPTSGAMRVLDPACGDGRLLSAICDRLGDGVIAVGADVDAETVAAIDDERLDVHCVDGLSVDWSRERGPFDLVIANPPFLSQMATATSRRGASRFGGGPYANAAMEFCLAGVLSLRPGGRMVILLPQSVLTARDAAALRSAVTGAAHIVGSWWSPERPFDAEVNVCMLVFERRDVDIPGDPAPWSSVVTEVLDVPQLALPDTGTTIGDRARATANFRDEYYALVPAVSDGAVGPPLVTSGLIDPGRCRWGERPVRFAKQRLDHPRVDLDQLEGRFRPWAEALLVPKVLVAAQTRVVEAVADRDGSWLPGVPVVSVVPHDPGDVDAIAALLTSPVATLHAWQTMAGSGLAPTSVRLSPSVIMSVPWPRVSLDVAVEALTAGDLVACGEAVLSAFSFDTQARSRLIEWWARTGRLV
jgi:SAM-dependent methyltransferase